MKTAVTELDLAESLAAGEAINPLTVEEMVLGMAGTAAGRYLSLQSSWRALQDRMDVGGTMSFAEALTLHAQLGYVERRGHACGGCRRCRAGRPRRR